jgi:hypothetical protein
MPSYFGGEVTSSASNFRCYIRGEHLDVFNREDKGEQYFTHEILYFHSGGREIRGMILLSIPLIHVTYSTTQFQRAFIQVWR